MTDPPESYETKIPDRVLTRSQSKRLSSTNSRTESHKRESKLRKKTSGS